MSLRMMSTAGLAALLCLGLTGISCSDEEEIPQALVRIHNDFNNPTLERRPPWTICKCNYQGVEFGKVLLGDSSAAQTVSPGLDYVLMVLAWNDTTCDPLQSLPVASRFEEEVVGGQQRIIAINAPNHQGPCPPEGIPPIAEELYNRIRELYPEYEFQPYENRTQNPQCLPQP